MKFYISPSSQEANVYATGTNEEVVMNLIADALCSKLVMYPDITYMRNNKKNTYAGHVAESDVYKPDVHLAIHSNALNGTARGCEVFCYDPANPNSLGTRLANILYNKVAAITPTKDRGVKAGTMAEVRSVRAPAALIEIAFHDNMEDALWIVSHICDLANAILQSMLELANIPYIDEAPSAVAMRAALKQIKSIASSY